MNPKVYTISAKVWRWQGQGGWHFVAIDTQTFHEIRQSFGKGMVPITLTLNGAKLTATLFPHLQTESYLLAIKKAWRQKLDIQDGDTIEIQFQITQK